MVKNKIVLILLLIVLTEVSCNTWYITKEGGFRPVKPNFSSLILDSGCGNDLIDIDEVYRLYESYLGDYDFFSEKREYYESVSSNENAEEPIAYIKFYEDCKYRRFFVKKSNSKSLRINDFNTRKGTLGVFSFINDDLINMEEFMNIEGSGKYIKGKAMIYGDTVHVIMKIYNQISHNIYIKQNIPSDSLDRKP